MKVILRIQPPFLASATPTFNARVMPSSAGKHWGHHSKKARALRAFSTFNKNDKIYPSAFGT
ncbi:hypothetical protein A3843_14980 [Pseudovibrio exalbescens]|uniref:Uncharacterized protein n=1 Tax=Pseudovibrio exalbescens TaxID=197461 RepID=A0A1U7JE64_9HYPH|nr:hypothetical protein A3843_14980 [Pseudovibrio exalbescens]